MKSNCLDHRITSYLQPIWTVFFESTFGSRSFSEQSVKALTMREHKIAHEQQEGR